MHLHHTPIAAKHIQGMIERITFHNPDNGFCVLRVKVQGYQALVTVVAHAFTVSVGEHIECSGEWYQDQVYGQQFKAIHYLKSIPPSTLEGMEKYLGSGLVKGVGVQTAKVLIKAFGQEIFTILEHEPDRLMALPGISTKRKKQMIESWAEQKSIRDMLVFLQSYGLSTARAMQIYKRYGDAARVKVTENPYQLALDIQGIGFKTADDLALRLGCALDSMKRARAGVHYVLQEHCHQGHCAAESQHLVKSCTSLLNIPETIIKEAIDQEVAAEHLVYEHIDDMPCIFPTYLHRAECESAQHLLRILKGKRPWGAVNVGKEISWVEEQCGLQLAESQKQAVEIVFKHKLGIITGGPGVGKTTIVNSILKLMRAKGLSVALCAPTGKAAKRLTETTGLQAKTIHRLLGFNPKNHSFKHHQHHPLPIDALVVDEASMIDTVLLHHLLKAIPDHAALLFVGDSDQLPSVSPGAVLMDMIRSKLIPTIRLTQIFRQAADSHIIINAHRINQGELPLAPKANATIKPDFYALYANNPEEIHAQLMEWVAERLPKYLNCNPLTDIQVLTPMNRGSLGSTLLNVALQKKLNGQAEPKVTRFGVTFAPGDKVIQIVNNYDKEVFNGDIGFVTHINLDESLVKVAFDQRVIAYAFNDLDQLSLAYAISIHKSQGSEFPVVILLLSMQHYMLLAKNLLYAGVTRGKRCVVLIGEKKAVAMAVKNNRENKRLTKLSQRLRAPG